LSTCRARFGERILSFAGGKFTAEETQLTQLTLQVGSIPEVQPSHSVIEAAIKPWHDQKKDVEIIVPYELLLEAQAAARRFSIILGTIASISLLVGGIGIMNIMLATVTERTREIGIRRALGAKRRDITQQFLIETIVLSGVGGLIGVALGIAVPQGIVYFIPEQKIVVTLQSIVLAFGISAAVGVLFGIYPAMRAARMDPIEALRHE
jgi:putative ABC transport system permease protein